MIPEAAAAQARFLSLLSESLAVCQLPEGSPTPDWMPASGFWARLNTPGEQTLVCEQGLVPAHVRCEAGWRAIGVQGPLDFSLVGVLAGLAAPLAQAGVSIFALSSFATDYILVKQADLEKARQALLQAGHIFLEG